MFTFAIFMLQMCTRCSHSRAAAPVYSHSWQLAAASCAHLYGASAQHMQNCHNVVLPASRPARRLTLHLLHPIYGVECNMRRPNRTARFLQLFNDVEQQLVSGVDFDSLDSPGRIDWHLFRK